MAGLEAEGTNNRECARERTDTKPGSVGFVGATRGESPITNGVSEDHRAGERKAELLTELRRRVLEKFNASVQPRDRLVLAPDACPPLPRGVHLLPCQPKEPPIAIDECSVVTDVDGFIRAELRELHARLHSPVQIRGGWGVFAILDRLRQVGLELEIVSPN
jgi:hypothetical protein